LNADILAGNAAKQETVTADMVSKDGGEGEHYPLPFKRGETGAEVPFS